MTPWSSQIHRCSRAKGPGKQKETQAKHLLGGTLLASGRGHVGETATENHMINGFKIFLRGRCQKSDFRNGAFIQILYKVARIANGLVVGSQRPLKLLSPAKGDRRKFRSQTSDNMDRCKAEMGRVRDENRREEKRRDETKRDEKRREKKKTEHQKKESLRRKKIQVREKVGKSRNTMFFQWCVAPEGRKVGSLSGGCVAMWSDERWKIAHRCGAKHMSKSKCTKHTMLGPLLEIEMSKSARRCGAKHIWKSKWTTPCSDHFWKLTCRKSARRCCAKHIWKSKCTKHAMLGPLLEVDMSKKCTPLWREAHFEVKMYKTRNARTTFGSWHVEKVHAIVARSTFRSQKCKKLTGSGTFGSWHVEKVHTIVARSTFGSQNVQNTPCSDTTFGSWHVEKAHTVVARSTFRSQKCKKMTGSEHFWTFRCRFVRQAQGIVHRVKSAQNVRARDISRGSEKIHFQWQAQYKRHVHQRC